MEQSPDPPPAVFQGIWLTAFDISDEFPDFLAELHKISHFGSQAYLLFFVDLFKRRDQFWQPA